MVIDELELAWRRCPAPIVAVTGTNGKSTTAALIQSALQRGGVEATVAGNTLFGPPLSGLEIDADRLVVCEVSSFQLEGCDAFLPEAAVLTTLSPEHLDRHGTMERYAACKARMFVRGDRAVPLAAVNADLPLGRRLIGEVGAREGRAVSFGTAESADYRLARVRSSLTGSSVTIQTPAGAARLDTRLPGRHNALNVTAAFALCDALGIDRGDIEEAIQSAAGVPGRFELIDGPQPFSVVVDFAHNEAGLRTVVRTAREALAERPGGRILAVVSAARFFDSSQRLAIGRAARESTDQLILTSDRWPGDPPGISDELIAGARQVEGADLRLVEDRREAIEAALRSAAPHDVVLMLGRGPFTAPMLDPSGRGSPFDDREVARELLRALPAAAA